MSKKQKYTYDEIFQRNIGVFTPEEQERIKNLKVAIAGAGGLGGPVAITLARLGVGRISIADADKFEISNLNRQSGAYLDTLGKHKSEVIASEVKRINPHLEVECFSENIERNNVDKFLQDADCVVDGIDFFALDSDLLLHDEAVSRDLWVFTCQGALNITSFITFNPRGVTLRDKILKEGGPDLRLAIESMLPELPKGVTEDELSEVIKTAEKKGKHYIPSYSVIAPFNGSFLVENLVRVMIRRQKPLVTFPELYYVNLDNMTINFVRNA
jgi:molybdopterin/thiamine biosynthesis adenylyltransferase